MYPEVYGCSAANMAAVGDIPRPLLHAFSRVTLFTQTDLLSSVNEVMTLTISIAEYPVSVILKNSTKPECVGLTEDKS